MDNRELSIKIAVTLLEELIRLYPLIREAKKGVMENTIAAHLRAIEPPVEANERCERLRNYKATYDSLNSLFKRIVEDIKVYEHLWPDLGQEIGELPINSIYFYLYYPNNRVSPGGVT